MSELDFLVAELENGSTDLANCLSSRPNLSHEEQFQLVLADQKYRIRCKEPFSVEHCLRYVRILPWLAADLERQEQLIVNEFMLRLMSESGDALLDQYATRYSDFGLPLMEKLRSLLHEQTQQYTSDDGEGTFGTQFPSKLVAPVVPVDLTGSFITTQTVGDFCEGRYRFVRKLGQGNYGAVYLAQDMELKRQVAVKVPSREALAKLVDVDSYLVEARTVAGLDHPNIVTVHDVGRTHDGSVFVVSKFINGCSLAEWIKNKTLDFQEIAKLLEKIAEALHHAHKQRLIHRDIKPANILIEESTGTPYVADFGLAIHEEDYVLDGRVAGTPAFMSPEQARGEGHRLDGRSDLFSLGVVMYQMLTGRLPFLGQSYHEITHKITTVEPQAPRNIKSDIPAELERICLKLLRKRASERYANGQDLAEDLRAWLARRTNQTAYKKVEKITPRGLRSFTADDAGFFLDLLPGPHNRDGLPESIAFWKERIEQRDPDQTFTVGLLYGPSGCGKSSLVKAGLIPNLSSEVIAIYIEATPEETESRVLRQLQKRIPELPRNLELFEIAERIRRSEGPKVVFIVDQFEQWLYSHRPDEEGDLVRTLRQCDGKRLQAVLMIRDDFYLAAARMMNQIDVPILTGQNFKLVDLFDREHARRVLFRFGESYDKLPMETNLQSPDQIAFIDQVVQGLSENNKVVSVRLSLLADMLKGRDWVPSTLEAIGGLDGIGISFLEETFASSRADVRHRAHQIAVRGVLRALLPDLGADIKGSIRSEEELLEASGYTNRRQDFGDLMRMLDGELRLITPTNPEGDASNISSRDPSRSARYYQLTHDYLVPSLREWLTRKQRETSKGRSELMLSERAAAWSLKRENKQLPTLVEWLRIRQWTEPADWKPHEKAVMLQATRHHVQRLSMAAAVLALVAVAGLFMWRETSRQREEIQIAKLVNTLTKAEPKDIPDIIKKLDANPEVAAGYLAPLLSAKATTPDERQARLHAMLASVARDPMLLEPLEEEFLNGKVDYVLPIRHLFRPSAAKVSTSFSKVLHDSNVDPQRRFRAALALAEFASSDETIWTEPILTFIAQELVLSNSDNQLILRDALRPIQDKLLTKLERIFNDASATDAQRLIAANAIADYAAKDRERLTRLLTLATPEQYKVLFPLVSENSSSETIAQLSEIVTTQPPNDLGSVPRIEYGQRRANAAVTMLKLGEKEKVLAVFHWKDDPEAMTQFIFRCKPRGIHIDALLDLLDIATRSASEGSDDAISTPISDPSVAHGLDRDHALARYSLLLAIGEYDPTDIPATRREALVKQLANWYANDPSSGVHGASGWLLRHLGEREIADGIDQTPVPYSPNREWFTLAITIRPTPQPSSDRHGETEESETVPEHPSPKTFFYTFIVHPGGEYTIGSPEDQPGRLKDEVQHVVRMPRSFAILDREITFEELIAFSPQYAGFMETKEATPSDAGFGSNWYEAVAFCRWLGQEMGLSEPEQCYADPEKLDEDNDSRDPEEMLAPRNWLTDLNKRGFRLPTESEWEVIARSGTQTAYGFGSEVALLDHFGWFNENSGEKVHPVREKRPNVRGLFDLHGNLVEWTHDWNRGLGEPDQADSLRGNTASNRGFRGGSWRFGAGSCRSAYRIGAAPLSRNEYLGFRLALVPIEDAEHSLGPRAGAEE